MEFVQLDHITPRVVFLAILALGAGWFLFKATKHLLVAGLFVVVGLGAVGFWTGVLTTEKAQAAADAVKGKALELGEKANDSAKKIGGQAYSTSAGGASQTNQAYEKNVEGK